MIRDATYAYYHCYNGYGEDAYFWNVSHATRRVSSSDVRFVVPSSSNNFWNSAVNTLNSYRECPRHLGVLSNRGSSPKHDTECDVIHISGSSALYSLSLQKIPSKLVIPKSRCDVMFQRTHLSIR